MAEACAPTGPKVETMSLIVMRALAAAVWSMSMVEAASLTGTLNSCITVARV